MRQIRIASAANTYNFGLSACDSSDKLVRQGSSKCLDRMISVTAGKELNVLRLSTNLPCEASKDELRNILVAAFTYGCWLRSEVLHGYHHKAWKSRLVAAGHGLACQAPCLLL